MGARHRARAHAIQVNFTFFSSLTLSVLRSSDVRLFQLESAGGLWSPRCTTARSSSLSLAGFPSRVVPSSRPTGPTPTSSRRAFYRSASCPWRVWKAGVVAARQPWTIKADSSGFREVSCRCLAEMAKQLIQLIIAGSQVNLSYHKQRKVEWGYHDTGGGESI